MTEEKIKQKAEAYAESMLKGIKSLDENNANILRLGYYEGYIAGYKQAAKDKYNMLTSE